jgi:type II secretory pathway predicted ATPase ExeA
MTSMTYENPVSPANVFGRPRPQDVWLGPAQCRALSFALEALSRNKTGLLLGMRGCGKSTVLDTYLENVPGSAFFRLRDRWESGAALLEALVESAGAGRGVSTDAERRDALRAYLETEKKRGRTVIFAVDDAQLLANEAWLELSRLSAIDIDGYSPHLLVVGRPETLDLFQPALTGGLSAARIVVHRMASATQDDANAYILHRMRSADLPASLFTAAARMLVAKLADGSFARVNLLCQGAMVLLQKRRLQQVDEKLVTEANKIFGRSPAPSSIPLPEVVPQAADRKPGACASDLPSSEPSRLVQIAERRTAQKQRGRPRDV